MEFLDLELKKKLNLLSLKIQTGNGDITGLVIQAAAVNDIITTLEEDIPDTEPNIENKENEEDEDFNSF